MRPGAMAPRIKAMTEYFAIRAIFIVELSGAM
jgi:hypothetical protein